MPVGSRLDSEPFGIVVGMAAEARIVRRLSWPVAIGGGTPAGARTAALRLLDQGVRGLVSIGLAGGLDSSLRPGTVLVPEAVTFLESDDLPDRLSPLPLRKETNRESDHAPDLRLEIQTDSLLAQALGGMTSHRLLCATGPVTEPAEKQLLWRETGCAAVDLESGAVASLAASRGIGFAALRVICDPAERRIPQAALVALSAQGKIALLPLLACLIRNPGQLPALLALVRDAAGARRALADRVTAIQRAAARRPAT